MPTTALRIRLAAAVLLVFLAVAFGFVAAALAVSVAPVEGRFVPGTGEVGSGLHLGGAR